jgi:putative ABC transport system permease protein
MILGLAVKSLRNRKFTAALTVLSIALAVTLLLGVERIRHESRESFASTVSGTDLIVGARGSPVHLLLYSVFRIGNATSNVTWTGYRMLSQHPEIAWTIPLSLGDSHRGFRVLGTTAAYFEHFRFAHDRALELAQGTPFAGEADAVLGGEVAQALGYKVGDSIVIAHGAGDVSFSLHRDHPFTVVGVLARTGTPVDRTVHVTLDGLDAVHAEANARDSDDPLAAAMHGHDAAPGHDHSRAAGGYEPGHVQIDPEHQGPERTITAFLVGLKSRGAALSLQRVVNEYAGEPLTAILPGPTLMEVWDIVGAAEKTLFAVSALVVAVGLAGMLVALLTSLSERRREMAILRSVGARPAHVFGLILGEAAFLTLCGIALGIAALYAGLIAGRPWLESRLGLFIAVGGPSGSELILVALVAAAGALIGLIPAYRIYRYSLADGMTIRV